MKDNKRNGIGRDILEYIAIQEGQFLNDKLNGFGREFFYNGEYYIGEYKDSIYHGEGKYVYNDDKIEDGIWEYGIFIE
jgi:hypothetical protein